jgi:Phosphodiester glycosidase
MVTRSGFFFCVLFVSVVFAVGGWHQSSAQSLVRAPETTLGKLKYGDLAVSIASAVANETFVVSYISFKPTELRVGLVQPQNPAEGGTSLNRFKQDMQPVALMNGGFLDSTSPATPAGFLKVAGQIVNRASTDRVIDGFLCFSNGPNLQAVTIGPYADLERVTSDYPDCTQGGPLLILDGKPFSKLEALDEDPNLKKFGLVAAARSFVAKTKTGNIIMGVTSPVSLYSLRSVLLQDRSAGGFEATQAIGLTGRITAGLIAGSAFVRGHTNTLLPAAIIVRN